MIRPNANYRCNPKRAVFVFGEIGQQLVERLTPQILSLQADSREPITLFIDSPGGSTASQEALARLLRVTDQDLSDSCPLITVVTGLAASAAADLLCSGSYAIAHYGSTIFFHGVRQFSSSPITVDKASQLVESLRLTNDRYAMSLADQSLSRFGFRFVSLRPEFNKYRSRFGAPTLTDLECFIGMIREKLSLNALDVVRRAQERNSRYAALIKHVLRGLNRSKRVNKKNRFAIMEAIMLKEIAEFELSRNKEPSWSFSNGGLIQLNADFLLMTEYLRIYDSPHLRRLCDRFGGFFLEPSDETELGEVVGDPAEQLFKKQEKLKPILRPLWLFFVALCYTLQEDENSLTSSDAFWLGLIDEVIGGPDDMNPVRLVLEYVPDEELSDNLPTT